MHISQFLALGSLLPFAATSRIQQPLGADSPPLTPHGSAAVPGSSSPSSSAPSWRDDLLSLHRSLIEIPSISGNESAAGKFLVDYLTSRGYVSSLQFLPPRNNNSNETPRFNVLAWKTNQRQPEPRVVISSHYDVVPPHIPYGISDENITPDTRISGRGSVDAKASVAAQIIALEDLFSADKVDPDDVMLLFVIGEEDTGDGMRFFSDSLQEADPPVHFDAVIFGEPTEGKLACGHKGGVFCDITAKGVAGHSGYPWLGKSANEIMIKALAKIITTDLGSTDKWGNTTVNVGQFNGGVAQNVIPAAALARIAVRVAIGPEKDGGNIVKDRIQKILDETDSESLEMTCTHGYGVVEANCDVDGFETIVANYGTDIPNLKGSHTRYLYGPGTILVAHGRDENITVADLEEAVGVLNDGNNLLLPNYLGPPLRHNVTEVKVSLGVLDDGALLRDNSIDQVVRRHIESRVPDIDALVGRRNASGLRNVDGTIGLNDSAGNLRQLLALALLDLDASSSFSLKIDAGGGSRNNKLDTVMFGENSQLVRSNLVGGVTVANDAVGADDDGGNVHLLLLQVEERGRHGVCHKGAGDLLVDEFKSRQSAALVVRPRLGAVGVLEEVVGPEGSDNAESGSVARCRQRAGVAPLSSVVADGQVGLEVLLEDVLSLLDVGGDDGLGFILGASLMQAFSWLMALVRSTAVGLLSFK
ncbi:peptidase M20 domain-containing protein [Colletotrichum spaethianum]|uniref:Peptidase M20 domain-containing protein n=1 Tax=Colletotrichum spaethianum TaxID=700344 RepID=A0AA37LAC3_9PEZI|nr:peptidase M20 domain-containing protein [Colletotrichum spaethianum]GKT40677.1 peptidase M20 domain-containing protein [Colletotrichum spaethianum]